MIGRRLGRQGPALSAHALALALGLAPFAPAAAAAGAGGTQQDRDACEPDVFRLCLADIPDETRIVACLNARSNDLSPACRRVIDPAPRQQRSKG